MEMRLPTRGKGAGGGKGSHQRGQDCRESWGFPPTAGEGVPKPQTEHQVVVCWGLTEAQESELLVVLRSVFFFIMTLKSRVE